MFLGELLHAAGSRVNAHQQIVERQTEAWATVDRFEFRSLTLRAFKPVPAVNRDFRHAVIYRGPWRQVTTDFQMELARGERVDVCDAEFAMLSQAPYRDEVIALPNANLEIGIAPDLTPLMVLGETPTGSSCCSPGSGCC